MGTSPIESASWAPTLLGTAGLDDHRPGLLLKSCPWHFQVTVISRRMFFLFCVLPFYRTVVLTSHASKEMLKILQARLQ